MGSSRESRGKLKANCEEKAKIIYYKKKSIRKKIDASTALWVGRLHDTDGSLSGICAIFMQRKNQ